MEKLYVFAIGGSGERVMRSLILMLASGMKIGAKSLVPVFIDNDKSSYALKMCQSLISFYNSDPSKGGRTGAHSLYKNFTNNENLWGDFFKTKIEEPIFLDTDGANIGTLKEIIRGSGGVSNSPVVDGINEERDLLFSQNDLDMKLDVGFVGNPNIGSVVLNSVSLHTREFEGILGGISNSDGVFVVGSLFGGTGAAGLPLIVSRFSKLTQMNKPMIGGVAVLPYFTTNPATDMTPAGTIDTTIYNVDSDTFDTKTRAALMYYDKHMKNLDYLYYVGASNKKSTYEHCIGGERQNNPADIVEVMAALSAIDFSKLQRPNQQVVYKMPVWKMNDNGETNLSGVNNADLKKSLTKFQMMKKIFASTGDGLLEWSITQNKDYTKNIGFTNEIRKSVVNVREVGNSNYSWGVCYLIDEWSKWIKELGSKFKLYDDNTTATGENLTHLFYTEQKKGIAKIVATGILRRDEAPASAGIAEAMQSAYKKLLKETPALNANIEESKKLPIMLSIISMALDEVIEKNCMSLNEV